MPRKKKSMRADHRFEYKIVLGRDINGKLIRKSFYSTVSMADAKTQATEYKISLEVSARTGEAFIESKYTFSQWVDKWLETYKKPFVSYNTYVGYEGIVRLYIKPYFKNAALPDIRPADVQRFAASVSKLSGSHVKKIQMCLMDIFETAIENDLCFKNPARRIQFKSTVEKQEKRVLTSKQIEIVRAAAVAEFPAVALLLDTGMRRGELLGLMWTDCMLSPGSGEIKVQRSVSSECGKLVLHPPKKNSYRRIPIGDCTIALLRTLPRESLYVFPNQNGGLQDVDHFSKRVKRFMQRMQAVHPDIPDLTPHELRHTYGTELRRRGVDIYTIQKVLGHRNINVTSNTYVRNEIEPLRTALFG